MEIIETIKNRFEDSVKMAIFSKFKTNNTILDTIITTFILSVVGYIINYLYDKNNKTFYNISFTEIICFFYKKNQIIYEGKISYVTSGYNLNYTITSNYSDRFKAIWNHIIININNNTSIYEIKESHSNGNMTTEFKKFLSDIYIVTQKKPFYIDTNIYARCIIDNENLRNNSERIETKVDKITIHIYSYVYSIAYLKNYIDKITHEYISSIRTSRQNKKFIYTLEKTKYDESPKECWDEFEFESTRNVHNVFIDGKKEIFDKIDFFLNNKKWYYEKGIPYTLGIGLSGPPGTGKTTLIKTICNHSDRHLVNISVKLLKTRKDLYKFYFEQTYNNDNDKNSITFDKKIIVFEDIDCIGDIILSRENKNLDLQDKSKLEDENDQSKIMAFIKNLMEAKDESRSQDKENKERVNLLTCLNREDDLITLDDILNLWDGLRETPGRILIITSNYYNKLDSALIRPGRIDISYELKNASHNVISDMYFHLFGNKIDNTKLLLIQEYLYSPAELINVYLTFKEEESFMNRLLENEKVK
jgi:hypothetical protein